MEELLKKYKMFPLEKLGLEAEKVEAAKKVGYVGGKWEGGNLFFLHIENAQIGEHVFPSANPGLPTPVFLSSFFKFSLWPEAKIPTVAEISIKNVSYRQEIECKAMLGPLMQIISDCEGIKVLSVCYETGKLEVEVKTDFTYEMNSALQTIVSFCQIFHRKKASIAPVSL